MRSPGEMWGMVEEGNGHHRGGRTAWRGDSRVQTRRTCKRVRTVLHGTLGHLPTQGRDLAPPGGHHMAAAHTSHPALGLLRSACAEEVRGSPTRHSVMPTRGPYSEDVGLPREPGAPGAPRTGALTTLRSSRRQSAPQLLSLPVAESQPRPGPAPSSSAAPPLAPPPASAPPPVQAPPHAGSSPLGRPRPCVPCVTAAAWKPAWQQPARAFWGGTSGGVRERLPAARENCPAGIRDMKVSPAAAGRAGVRAPRSGLLLLLFARPQFHSAKWARAARGRAV